MKQIFYLFLFLVLVSIAVCDESNKSGGSDESDSKDSGSKPHAESKESKKRKCEDLVQCDEAPGSPTCTCDLTDGLEQVGNNSTQSNLTASEKTTWMTLITQIKTTVLIDSSKTTYQKVVEVNSMIQTFKQTNTVIYEKVEFGVIKPFGKNRFVVSDLDEVSTSMMDETASSATSLFSNNSCNLFEAFRNASSGNATFTSAINVVIADITVILQDTNLKYEEQNSQIWDKIDSFVKANPSYKDKLFKTQIKDFYTVEGFQKVTKKYKQSTMISTVISGDSSTNVVLKKLKEKYTDMSLPQDVRDKIQLFYNLNDGFFASESDSQKRLKQLSYNYYQFLKTNPELKKYLDKIKLSDDFGSFSELISVSTIVYPAVDCSTDSMDQLISGPWNASTLVQSFYETYEDWNKTYSFQGLSWGLTQWALFRTSYINNNISLIISDPTLPSQKKHKRIAEVMQIFLNGFNDSNFFYCVPFGQWGFAADYKTCNKISSPKSWKCSVPWDCLGPRQNVIKIKPDNTTDFGMGMEQFINSTNSTTTQTQIRTYYEQIKQVIYVDTTYKRKAHKVSQIVQIVKTMKTTITTVNFDTVSFGKFGKMKKFVDCQDTAKAKDFK